MKRGFLKPHKCLAYDEMVWLLNVFGNGLLYWMVIWILTASLICKRVQ